MTEQPFRSWWQTPILPAAVLAFPILVYGYDRDAGFVIFMLSPALWPVLLVLVWAGAASLFSTFKIPSRRRECYWAIAIILATPLLAIFITRFRDPMRFLVWAPFHLNLLRQSPDQDRMLTPWDTWGWVATGQNDSYLVRNVEDRLTSLDQANAWAQSHGSSCEIVRTERVWPKLYVLTTYNCGF